MKKKPKKDNKGIFWVFALLNGRLSEITFEEKKNRMSIVGHCYVKRLEYKTKKEQKMIDKDIKRWNLSYRKREYKFKHRWDTQPRLIKLAKKELQEWWRPKGKLIPFPLPK